jgi:hypothetical protein
MKKPGRILPPGHIDTKRVPEKPEFRNQRPECRAAEADGIQPQRHQDTKRVAENAATRDQKPETRMQRSRTTADGRSQKAECRRQKELETQSRREGQAQSAAMVARDATVDGRRQARDMHVLQCRSICHRDGVCYRGRGDARRDSARLGHPDVGGGVLFLCHPEFLRGISSTRDSGEIPPLGDDASVGMTKVNGRNDR